MKLDQIGSWSEIKLEIIKKYDGAKDSGRKEDECLTRISDIQIR